MQKENLSQSYPLQAQNQIAVWFLIYYKQLNNQVLLASGILDHNDCDCKDREEDIHFDQNL